MANKIYDEIKCLDTGFVRLVDYMGGDNAIVQAARVSYGAGTKSVSKDRELIRYLMRNRHTSPFEMVEFKFHVKLPIFVARQWIRHRTANVNEYSGRYSVMKNEFYLPEASRLAMQSKTNMQGSEENSTFSGEDAEIILAGMEDAQSKAYREYDALIESGLTRELARINLPLSTYTEWYWKIDLHNLLHFLRLRLDYHAQKEIAVYGEAIADIVKAVCPLTYEAFEDYILNSATFSALELKALNLIINKGRLDDEELSEFGLNKFERIEFNNKIADFDI